MYPGFMKLKKRDNGVRFEHMILGNIYVNFGDDESRGV